MDNSSELSWRAVDIASAHTLRWLIEVFFEDWKLYEGWGQLAPQWDEEGSSRGLTLSLLLDHALLLHPNNEPASRTTCRRVPSVAGNSNPEWTH